MLQKKPQNEQTINPGAAQEWEYETCSL